MIRFASNEDVIELKSMWYSIFGDEMSYIDLFFDEIFSCDNTLVYEKYGDIAAMLYIVDYSYKQNEKVYKLSYLYALATKDIYRGKGIMNELLDEATKLSKERDKDALMLIPEDEKLLKYYKKRGFETIKSLMPIKLNGEYECEQITVDEIKVESGVVLSKEQIHFLKSLMKLEKVNLYSFKRQGRVCRYELAKNANSNEKHTIMMKFITNFTVFDEDIISLLLV